MRGATKKMEGKSEKAKTNEDEVHRPPSRRQPYPWLVIQDGAGEKRQTFYSVTEDRYYVRFIPEMQNKFIALSYKEWLVLADNDTYECLLLNLSTMEKVHLPATDVQYYRRCVLSSPTMDASCRVLFFNRNRRKFRSCHIGDTEFVEHDLIIDFDDGLAFTAGVSFEEKLYVMTADFNLMVANFNDPELHLAIVIRGDQLRFICPFSMKSRHYLVEYFGELLFVLTRYENTNEELSDLKVYRADLHREEWVPIESLGDRVIFFNTANCFVFPASAFGLRGNSAYYVNKFGRNLFVYDLEDESITMSLPCPIISSSSALSWVSVPYDAQ